MTTKPVTYPVFPVAKARHRVSIQRLTTTPDASGGYTQSWVTKATVWAAIENFALTPRYDKEPWVAEQHQSSITQRITIRYIPGVTTKDRVLRNNDVYAIHGVVNPLEMNAVLELLVTRSTPGVSQ